MSQRMDTSNNTIPQGMWCDFKEWIDQYVTDVQVELRENAIEKFLIPHSEWNGREMFNALATAAVVTTVAAFLLPNISWTAGFLIVSASALSVRSTGWGRAADITIAALTKDPKIQEVANRIFPGMLALTIGTLLASTGCIGTFAWRPVCVLTNISSALYQQYDVLGLRSSENSLV